MKFLLLYAILINLIGFFFMYSDKQKSIKGQYRIKEATLWKVVLLGGALGSTIAMFSFRHKTKHSAFKIGFPVFAVFQTVIFIILCGKLLL